MSGTVPSGLQTPPARERPATSRDLLADGSGRDRQTLVVGSGPAALATAGFLDQAGLDPVLARGPDTPDRGAVVLWQPGLVLLERLGLRRPVETLGTPLTALRCVEPARSWTERVPGREPPVAIRSDHLEAVMRRHVADRFRSTDRTVASVRPNGAGVVAAFEDGIEEPFDAVATTQRAVVPDGKGAGSQSVGWWSFDWPESVPAPGVATEAWGVDGAVFAVPLTESVRADLVATGGAAAARPLSPDALCEQFGGLAAPLGDALAALDGTTLQYRQTACGVPGALCVDGVAAVGPAAHASVPGGCLSATLAVEDGWVLADALAYGPEPVADALAAYADRRRKRLVDISSALQDETLVERVSPDLQPPLDGVCARRTLAFGHLFGVAEGLVRDVPEQL